MPEHDITLRFLAAPTDVGLQGHVGGGTVLEWIDKAGYAAAAAWSGCYCVTAYVGNIQFTRSIESGELVEVRARIVRTGRTSMTVLAEVSSSDPKTRESSPAMRCALVFVAVDENGKPTPITPFVPADAAQEALAEDAVKLASVRTNVDGAMAEQAYPDDGEAERVTLRFLAAPTDVNWGGKVHGGTVMRWIDEAAYTCAQRWTHGEATAVYAGGVRFYRPLFIGHLVEVEARLLQTTSRSMHIAVHVRSGDPKTRDLHLTTHCLIVYIGLDADGTPSMVPPWTPTSETDLALEAHAQNLQELRSRVDYEGLFSPR